MKMGKTVLRNQGKVVLRNQACVYCGSKDNRQVYDDGWSHCFSPGCPKPHVQEDKMDFDDLEAEFAEINGKGNSTKKTYNNNYSNLLQEVNKDYPFAADNERKIPIEVMKYYGCRVAYDATGKLAEKYYAYGVQEDKQASGFKIRVLPKDFSKKGSIGKISGLYGSHLHSGGGKRLIIVEGEEDAHAIQAAWFKKYKTFYPVESLRGASITKDLIEDRQRLRSFDEVILWLDNDEAGQTALKEAVKIIGFDKVKIAKAPEKDASEVWVKSNGDVNKLLSYVYNAQPYVPAGILTKEELWSQLERYNEIESVPYPDFMSGLNDKLKGMRLGEITLWTSGTGSGKSTLLREIALHLKETTTDKLGIISLEESPAETARKMAGMALNINPANEEIPLDQLRVGFNKVYDDDRFMILDHQGSISDGSIMDFLEYMCLSGCKYLFVDHITILASEGNEGLSGNEAIDKIMNDLLRLVKKHNVWIGLISHLRKTDNKGKSFEEGKLPSMDDIRGSGSIKQISMDIIAFSRNSGSEIEDERNTILTKVLKCRYTGLTGPSGAFHYDYTTGRLRKSANADFDVFDEVI
jgi:twinkle protein